jgi:hypothetical protein
VKHSCVQHLHFTPDIKKEIIFIAHRNILDIPLLPLISASPLAEHVPPSTNKTSDLGYSAAAKTNSSTDRAKGNIRAVIYGTSYKRMEKLGEATLALPGLRNENGDQL